MQTAGLKHDRVIIGPSITIMFIYIILGLILCR